MKEIFIYRCTCTYILKLLMERNNTIKWNPKIIIKFSISYLHHSNNDKNSFCSLWRNQDKSDFYYHCYTGLGKQKCSLSFSKDLISFPIINKV